MVKSMIVAAAVVALASAPIAAGSKASIVGDYVEARTAEVFVGACQLGNEGEGAGRQAVMAWRVTEGSYQGISLNGLSIVAAVAANTNLGWWELGGRRPSVVKAAVMIDERANPAQRLALLALVRTLSDGLVSNVVDVKSVPIAFRRTAERVDVAAGEAALSVSTELEHDPSCGAEQWFTPLARSEVALGVTRTQGYWGSALGAKWNQVDRRSSFFGTFAY
jgi:hypothetical protein